MNEFESDFLDLCSLCEHKSESILNKQSTLLASESKIKCSRENRPRFCTKCFKSLNFFIKNHEKNEEKIDFLNVVEACENLDNELKLLENLQLNQIKYIDEYFSELINKIDIRREKIILNIECKAKLILNKIKSFQLDCEKLSNQDLIIDANEIREKVNEWKRYLNNSNNKNLNLNIKKLECIKRDIEMSLKIVKHKEDCLKNNILIKKKFKFMDDNPDEKIESVFRGDFV